MNAVPPTPDNKDKVVDSLELSFFEVDMTVAPLDEVLKP
jgi:hypothetical protein